MVTTAPATVEKKLYKGWLVVHSPNGGGGGKSLDACDRHASAAERNLGSKHQEIGTHVWQRSADVASRSTHFAMTFSHLRCAELSSCADGNSGSTNLRNGERVRSLPHNRISRSKSVTRYCCGWVGLQLALQIVGRRMDPMIYLFKQRPLQRSKL